MNALLNNSPEIFNKELSRLIICFIKNVNIKSRRLTIFTALLNKSDFG